MTLEYIMLLMFTFGLFEAWLKTGLPVHVFEILFKVTKNPEFWSFPDAEIGQNSVSREEWELFVQIQFPYVGELLTCPRCFSWHLSLWTSILFALCTLNPLLLVVGITTLPVAINFLSSIQTRLES